MEKGNAFTAPEGEAVIYSSSAIFPQSLLVKSARKKVTRWTEVNSLASAETRGKMMGQYLLYKMEKNRVHLQLKQRHYAKLRQVLEKTDRDYIKKELNEHKQKSHVGGLETSHNQVENFRILHHEVKNMGSMGTPFLQNWLNTLVDGVLHDKIYYMHIILGPLTELDVQKKIGESVGSTKTLRMVHPNGIIKT
jgi:hypothetical protein